MNTLYQQALNLHHQQQFADAESKYREYLTAKSDNAEAWLNLGILYYQTENYPAAQAAIAKCLEIDAVNAMGCYVMGCCLERTDNINEAISAYQDAIALDSTLLDAYNNLGNLLAQIGEITQAKTVYRQAISANTQHFGSYINLGNLLMGQNQIDRAIEVYQTALTFNPGNADILNNLEVALNMQKSSAYILESANKLYLQGRYEIAIDKYQQFLETRTRDPQAYFYLSECFRNLNREEEAIRTLQEGIRVYPTAGQLHFALITLFQTRGRKEEAITSAESASGLLPNDYTLQILDKLMLPLVYDTEDEIGFYRQRFAKGLQDLIERTSLATFEDKKNALAGLVCVTTFYLGHQGLNVLDLQHQWGNLIHQIMAANYPNWVQPLSMPPLKLNNKIRIGYVSNYLHSYSGTLWLIGWLRNCDKQNFEVYCYYTGNDPDYMTKQFQNYSDVFHHIPGDLDAVCQQILADRLHILVFPEIGMDSQTVKMAGLRLAPVQCTAWGHPVTSGIPTIDYFLSSELMEPENAEEYYSEKLIRLPNIGVAYPKPEDIPVLTKNRADFGLPDDAVLYLCCQAPFKYLPQHDYIFAEIARRVSQAQFIFLRGELLKKRLERAFGAVGLNSEDYCVFLSIPTRPDYLMINLLSNVFLDTLSWSGGNTALEAIACNLPIVTCPGFFMRGRHADSFLKMLGVSDTIADNEAEYIDIAVNLGLDPVWRRDISERIKARHDHLYNDKVCVKALEYFYQQVVRG
ncbi:tetratricopeptide repeat protein [Argonema galeatum]|uniref:tetratricopeptide repeat protein n=1 Tax=Argonema galeatum TaxID=2942762 RepID=UPI0020125682|nr:tetratricopeptide repeat protein [Argonema galeatum A003/A1]